MTLSITALSIITLFATLSIIDTYHNDIQHNDTQNNDTQHKDTQHNDTQHNDTQHNKLIFDTC